MNSLRRLWAVALVEWKLQIRTIVFWAGLAVVLLYTLSQVINAPPEMMFLTSQWAGGRGESLTWLAIVLVFLVPSSLARDRRTAAFVCTTPVTGSVYAGGKLLGVWLTALTLAGIELAAQFLVRARAWERLTPEAVGMITASLGGWSIGIFYISSLYFLMTALVNGRALLAYALNIVYFAVTSGVRDVANPRGFVPSGFLSDLVGYGPESLLFSSYQLLYLGLAVVVSMLALMTYLWRERRSLFPRAERAMLLPGLFLSLLLAGWAGSVYAENRARVVTPTGLSPHLSSALTGEDVRSVRVTARFDPEQGHIKGLVELAFIQPLEDITLHVPPGLKLSAITDCHAQVRQVSHLNEEWMTIAFAPQLCVAFEGAWHASRAGYGVIKGPEEINLNVGAYVGQGYVYLTPPTRWYPAPVGPYEWATIHDIQITVPHALPSLVAPAAPSHSNSEWITYAWRNYRGRPLIMLVAGDYHQANLPGGDIVWASPEHQHVALQAADFYLGFLKPIDQFVRRDAPGYQVVETPVLRWPIVSGRMVLLPEGYFTERLSSALPTAYERDVTSFGPQQAFQQQAYRTARGRLLGQTFFADTSLISDLVEIPNPSLDPFSGFVPLHESLAHYLSLQLVDQQFTTHRLDEIMEARIRCSDAYLHDPEVRQIGGGGIWVVVGNPKYRVKLPAGPPYEQGWAFNHMFAAIGRLERRVGRERVNHMIGLLLERHYAGAITTADWLAIVNEVAGEEARREFEATSSVQTSQAP